MRRWITAAAALALLAGCSQPDDDTAPPSTTTTDPAPQLESAAGYSVIDPTWAQEEDRVAVIGDSITYEARDIVRDQLENARIIAVVGEGLTGGAISDAVGVDGAVELARQAQGVDVAVIALGAVDAAAVHPDEVDVRAAVDRVLDTLDAGCVVAVEVPTTSPAAGWDPAVAEAVNIALWRRADVVVDWAAPEYLNPDGGSPTPEGQLVFAASIAQGVADCS